MSVPSTPQSTRAPWPCGSRFAGGPASPNKACAAPLAKYYSIDTKHGFCGECCMKPSQFAEYKLFEPGLTAAEDDSPCRDFKYADYNQTVTHGFGPIKMTLDLYAPSA